MSSVASPPSASASANGAPSSSTPTKSQLSKEEYEAYLEAQQYSETGVLKYEFIFGEGFISTGGYSTTEKIAPLLQLKKGDKVLDVGCGIGGGAVYMAEKYGCEVKGIDLTSRCIEMAKQRYASNPLVTFEKADAMTMEVPAESYDVIYSRDAILHIEDKAALFRRFYQWVKPGGRIVISDYSCGPKEKWTEEFAQYLKKRQYYLVTVPEYRSLLQSVNFQIERADDESKWFGSILEEELGRLQKQKDAFLKKGFTQGDYDDLESGWKQKLQRIQQGCQTWGIYVAIKPKAAA